MGILLVWAALSLLLSSGWAGTQALADEESPGITRVVIVVTGSQPVVYTDVLQPDPPAIIIEFRSNNVTAGLEPVVVIESGIIQQIQSDYYPTRLGRRMLKSLTLNLSQPASYTIAHRANQILIDIETPPSLLPGRMAVGAGVTMLGIEARETLVQRLKVMGDALQQATFSPTLGSAKPEPVVVTKPVEILQPVFPPEPSPQPVSEPVPGGVWYGLVLGAGGVGLAMRRRARRTTTTLQAELRALENATDTMQKTLQEAEWSLSKERAKRQTVEQQVAELTRRLATMEQRSTQLLKEAEELETKRGELNQCLMAEHQKRAELEAQMAELEAQLKAAMVEEPHPSEAAWQGPENRRWPRLDLSARSDKGVLVNGTLALGRTIAGGARNLSAGGVCAEFPSSESLPDEFELRLFLTGLTSPIEAIGKLIWKAGSTRRGLDRAGLAFSAIDAPDQQAIEQFVAEG